MGRQNDLCEEIVNIMAIKRTKVNKIIDTVVIHLS